jgi:SPP1 family predicted phage head-tail adaptor
MPSAPKIGDLRERIALQRESRSRDRAGGFVTSWLTVATVWARVSPMSTGERFMRSQMQAAASWRVTIRYRDDLSLSPSGFRVAWRGRAFDVRGIENGDEQQRFLDLACDEIQVAPVAVPSMAGQPLGLLLAITRAVSPNTAGQPTGLLLLITKAV